MLAAQQCIAELELMTGAERREQDRWNETATDYPREATVAAKFEDQVALHSTSTAVKMGDQSLTYRELDEAAYRLASYHRPRVQPGAKVGLRMERSIGMIVSILAIIKAGGAYVPLDPTHPAERAASLLEDSEAGWLIVDQEGSVPGFKGETIVYGEYERAGVRCRFVTG